MESDPRPMAPQRGGGGADEKGINISWKRKEGIKKAM